MAEVTETCDRTAYLEQRVSDLLADLMEMRAERDLYKQILVYSPSLQEVREWLSQR